MSSDSLPTKKGRPELGRRIPSGGPLQKAESRLDGPTAEALCRLDLRPASLWRVLLAVLVASWKAGSPEVRVSVGDLTEVTGLSSRTVKGALAKLVGRKILTRVGRYERYRTNLLDPIPAGSADELSPPAPKIGTPGGVDKIAPRRGKLGCTSPTTISISSLEEPSSDEAFTSRQSELIADIFAEASELLGEEVTNLTLPAGTAASLGLTAPITYGEAHRLIARSNDRTKAHGFTRAVLTLRRDERVQGRELFVSPSPSPHPPKRNGSDIG